MALILIGALIIGLTVGLLGSGGSVVAVPVLVYLVGHHAKQAITESMAIVGLISIFIAIPYARSKQIDWRSVWYFGIPGMIGMFIGAWLGGLVAETTQLVVLGVVLLSAAYVVLRNPRRKSDVDDNLVELNGAHSSIGKMAVEGLFVGIVTGFVGVGGGFLIVPALVGLGKLPMRLAIGSSLVIIALNAAIGFAKYQQYLMAHDMAVDVQTVIVFVSVGVVGSFIGRYFNTRMDQRLLKRVFAVFLVLLGGFVVLKEMLP